MSRRCPGYGRPGLDMLHDQFEWYWLAGLRVQWAPFTWGSNGRDQQSLALQQREQGGILPVGFSIPPEGRFRVG